MDGTSSGTAYGETGNTIDFRQSMKSINLQEILSNNASYLERGNNGFGLKFYARTDGIFRLQRWYNYHQIINGNLVLIVLLTWVLML